MIKYNKGITIFEVIIMLFILVATTAVFVKWMANKQLLNTSKIYADQSYNYSLIFIKYLNNNESTIRAQLQNSNTITVSIDDLRNAGYVETTTSNTNLYGQTPCVIVNKNTNESGTILFPILFFTGGKSVNSSISLRAMSILGGFAGTFSSKTGDIVGNMGQWSYLDIADLPQNDTCNATLEDNSIALNLGMMSQYNNQIATDLSLHRIADANGYALGDRNNSNTVLTDISVTPSDTESRPNRIYLSSDNSPNNASYLTQNGANGVQANNAYFKAQLLKPNTQLIAGTSCTAQDVGSIVSQEIDHPEYELNTSNLICSYAPPMCQAEAGSDYCYLPQKNNTVIYNIGNIESYTANSFTCPGYTPIATAGKINNGEEDITYLKCPSPNIFSDTVTSYQSCKATGGYEQKGEIIYSTPINYTGSFMTSNLMADNVNYSVNVGYISAPTKTIDPTDCKAQCSAMGKSYDQGRTAALQSQGVLCACVTEDSYYRAILNVTASNHHPIQSVTCTNKMIFKAN